MNSTKRNYYLSIHPSIHPAIHPPLHPSIHPNIHPPRHLRLHETQHCLPNLAALIETYDLEAMTNASGTASLIVSISLSIHISAHLYYHPFFLFIRSFIHFSINQSINSHFYQFESDYGRQWATEQPSCDWLLFTLARFLLETDMMVASNCALTLAR